MRMVLATILLLLGTTSSFAVDFRWSSEVNRGTSNAMVANANRMMFNIYCAGADDQRAGLSIEGKRIDPSSKEPVDVQILVDGKNYPFTLEFGSYAANGRMSFMALSSLVDALAVSKNKSFVVEFPASKASETFSLLDAKKMLGGNRNSILGPCDPLR